MKSKFYGLAVHTVAIMILGSFGFAQQKPNASPTADKYLISAKAGVVNYTEGEISVTRLNGRSGVLLNRDQVEVGDHVSTGTTGKVEVLLNPGSYMRVGANSAFEFKTTSLDDLHIRIDKGVVLFEVFAANEFRVTVESPKGAVALIETGVYRVDVNAEGHGTISVYDGAAQIGDVDLTIIKKGRMAVIARFNIAVSKFDRGDKGELGDWSKSRSKELAKMTSSLKNQNMRNSLVSSFNSGGWNMFNSFGLWVFNPYSRYYCFLPFGQGWYSPYGYGYSTDFWWFNIPQQKLIDSSAGLWGPRNPSAQIDPASTGRTERQGGVRNAPDAEPAFKSFERSREPRQPAFEPGFHNNDAPRPGRQEIFVAPPVIGSPPSEITETKVKRDN